VLVLVLVLELVRVLVLVLVSWWDGNTAPNYCNEDSSSPFYIR
jgi:hypothetical protein